MDADVIIIGAGLSGLVAAREIQNSGKSVILLDKGRSVGGRLATRRIGNGIADHGAQFFTVRTDEFQKQVDDWLDRELVHVWGYGWSDGSIQHTMDDGHPRYVARAGMNSLAKDLASGINDINVDTKVAEVQWTGENWLVTTTKNLSFNSKTLIMTPPVPQSLQLLQNVPLIASDKQALKRIDYGPCLCGLFVIEGRIDLPEPGALQKIGEVAYWFADNTAKGISPDEHIITVHLNAGYSRAHYDDNPESNLAFIRSELQPHLGEDTIIKQAQLKKWRYSIPLTMHPDDILQAQGFPLIFAGDAFGGRARVEGAYLSGLAAAHAVME